VTLSKQSSPTMTERSGLMYSREVHELATRSAEAPTDLAVLPIQFVMTSLGIPPHLGHRPQPIPLKLSPRLVAANVLTQSRVALPRPTSLVLGLTLMVPPLDVRRSAISVFLPTLRRGLIATPKMMSPFQPMTSLAKPTKLTSRILRNSSRCAIKARSMMIPICPVGVIAEVRSHPPRSSPRRVQASLSKLRMPCSMASTSMRSR
jgi:hypothetical protein